MSRKILPSFIFTKAGLIGWVLFGLMFGVSMQGPSRPSWADLHTRPLTLYAAASLKPALDPLITAWHKDTGLHSVAVYAGSGTLARQIEYGARADLFLSADPDWMDYLDHLGLVRKETRSNLLSNRLALIAPHNTRLPLSIVPGFPLSDFLGEGRLAMGEVNTVPAGRYGKAALQALGVWNEVSGRLLETDNVRSVLRLVTQSEVPAGIVYESDTIAEADIQVIGIFPAGSHPMIIYPVAILAESQHKHALDFLRYLRSDRAREIFQKAGFRLMPS